ncbi:MAG TPA: A/G-specific adenine glycosylase [Longilinea sp.]|nr:A/G-specific adenine glycosylase [Longilinea sp.]
METPLAHQLLAWYHRNARRLPWRGLSDAYAIWVSEIMLQQTQVPTVIPYFERWMQHFPTLQALAAADEQDVLKLWEGLGYYSRARNLIKAAKMVVERHNGSLPSDRAALEHLPGIGRYTAGAIASIAFGQDEPALDGNIRRVLARIFDVQEPARSPAGEKKLWGLATKNLPPGSAGDYNQAMMDLGTAICTPHAPDCPTCPVNRLCKAYALGVQEKRPAMPVRRSVPHITVTAAVIHRDGKVLITRRPSKGLLGGMWEFPGGKVEAGESLEDGLKREISEELLAKIEVGDYIGEFHHAYTHFKVTLHAYHCTLAGNEPQAVEASDLQWVGVKELAGFPMGKIDRRISNLLVQTKSGKKGTPSQPPLLN